MSVVGLSMDGGTELCECVCALQNQYSGVVFVRVCHMQEAFRRREGTDVQ